MLQLPFALQFLVVIASGWVNRRQQLAIEYLLEENRVLREQLGSRRVRLTDAQRRRLAVRGKALGRKALDELAGLVTPATILPGTELWLRGSTTGRRIERLAGR